MRTDDKEDLLDQIAIADIGQLRQIIGRLQGMDQRPDVLELTDVAEDNIMALAGSYGDY